MSIKVILQLRKQNLYFHMWVYKNLVYSIYFKNMQITKCKSKEICTVCATRVYVNSLSECESSTR